MAVCIAGDQHGEFPHYVIVDDGVIDLANPLGTELSYTNIEILDTDEMPEAVTDEMVSWLRARGI